MKLRIGFALILCVTLTLAACTGSATPALTQDSAATSVPRTAAPVSEAETSTHAVTPAPTVKSSITSKPTSIPTKAANPKTPSPDKLQPYADSPSIGLWQFPTTKVWIKITSEGKTFQCRVAPDGLVYQSKGILTEDNKITWDRMWGVETITRVDSAIVLNGKYGEASYLLTIFEMDDVCRSPY